MGTYITPGQTRAQTVAEILEEYGPSLDDGAHKLVGTRDLWAVMRIPESSTGSSLAGKRLIVLFLLTERGDGYKPMDETEGPYTYTVPAEWLELVPDPCLGHSTKWRARARAYHEALATKGPVAARHAVRALEAAE